MSTKDLKAFDPTTFERVPPHNLEAEQSLLGAMLLSPDAIGKVVEYVRGEYFYREAHRHVFDAITKLFMAGEPCDPIVVAEELSKMGVLEKVGGKSYVHTLLNFVPTAANAEYYAQILQRHALLRALIRAATDIAAIGYEAPENLEAAIDRAESLIFNVSKKRISEKFSLLEELLTENWELMDKLARANTDITGVSTGFKDLDKYTSGLQSSDLIIIAARPAMGKTSLVLDIARNIAVDAGRAVAIFSLEMSKLQIAQRLLASEAMVPSQKLRSPARLTDNETERLVAASGRLSKARMFVDDTANITIMEIRAKARRLIAREELGLIIVDYLQLIHGGGRSESRQQEISEISRSLKILGRELGVPVIAVSQLSRAVESRTEDRRPRLSDLRECVTGDTLVVLADGRRVPIEDLVGQEPTVLAATPDGDIVTAKSDKVWEVGKKQVFNVVMSSGRTLCATAEHRLLGDQGWVKVGDLSNGARLALARHIPEPLHPIEWPDKRVALLGQMIGDGQRSASKRIPAEAFRLSNRQVGLLLQHLWATDGTITPRPEGKKGSHGVFFTSSSRGLANDVAFLLLRLGMVARIREVRQKSAVNPWYNVCLSGAADLRLFLDKVGAFGPRQKGAELLEARLAGRLENPNVDTLPRRVFDQIKELMRAQGMSHRAMQAARGVAYGGSAHFNFAPSRATVLDYAGILKSDVLRRQAENDMFWDSVVEVLPAGEEVVYDLTVPGTGCWLADGIVSHNSGAIEQDADIVMFIYRDERYNPDSEDKGKAELIIGKHRNGPVGTIKLAFLEEYTRFESLEERFRD